MNLRHSISTRVVCGLGATAALAGLAALWFLFGPRAVAPPGASLGPLPAGVRPDDLNVLLITLDTTRADRIEAYGFAGIQTPALNRLAREGVLFEHAAAPVPLTLPAHASIFTGKYPPHHGVRDNGGFFLGEHETTLAERLKNHGLQTGGFIGAYVLDSHWGVAQGFDTYFDEFDLSRFKSRGLGEVERPANEVADRALAWLETVAGQRFFAWVHFFDPHLPYAPPEPFKSRYVDQPYLGEIAFVDAQVGRLLAFLDERRLLRRTIVVVIGDHGESLGEHGESAHGFFLYQGVLRVPFFIRAPYDGLQGRRVSEIVRSIDVMPTVLELVGVPSADPGEGRSLVPLLAGAARELDLTAYAETVYPRFHYGWADLRALTDGRFKYVDAPRPELYDLEADPAETRNLFGERRTLADRMAARLRAIEQGAVEIKPVIDVDPDARARLAALGYVGAFVSTPVADRSALADPKDKVDVIGLLTEAHHLLRDAGGDPDKGLSVLQEVVARDPNVIDVWLMIGDEYARRGGFERAIEHYKQGIALKPDYDLAVTNLARAYRALGRDEDALAGYRRLAELTPENAQVWYEMAQIFLDQRRLRDAEAQLAKALSLEPKMAAARNALGALRLEQGRPDEAEREIRRALVDRPDLRLAHFNLALVAEQRGDLKTAVAEYQRELQLQPDSYRAHFNLGVVHGKLGDRVGELQAFRRAIESNPQFAEGYLFLARLYLDRGQQDDEAARLARKGLELAPRGRFAPLGHFVIADVYARNGRLAEANREAARGRQLEASLKRNPPSAAGQGLRQRPSGR